MVSLNFEVRNFLNFFTISPIELKIGTFKLRTDNIHLRPAYKSRKAIGKIENERMTLLALEERLQRKFGDSVGRSESGGLKLILILIFRLVGPRRSRLRGSG